MATLKKSRHSGGEYRKKPHSHTQRYATIKRKKIGYGPCESYVPAEFLWHGKLLEIMNIEYQKYKKRW